MNIALYKINAFYLNRYIAVSILRIGDITQLRHLIQNIVSRIPQIIGVLHTAPLYLGDLPVQLYDALCVIVQLLHMLFHFVIQVILIIHQTLIDIRRSFDQCLRFGHEEPLRYSAAGIECQFLYGLPVIGDRF